MVASCQIGLFLIWPRFKLLAHKILVVLLAFFWPHPKLAVLKRYVWRFGSFWLIYVETGSYEGKY